MKHFKIYNTYIFTMAHIYEIMTLSLYYFFFLIHLQLSNALNNGVLPSLLFLFTFVPYSINNFVKFSFWVEHTKKKKKKCISFFNFLYSYLPNPIIDFTKFAFLLNNKLNIGIQDSNFLYLYRPRISFIFNLLIVLLLHLLKQ